MAVTAALPQQVQEQVGSITEILTSSSGFQVTVTEAPTPSLALFRGITDQFIEANKPATFSLPADAFVHTKADAVITITAKLANGEDLPAWVQFDARSGTFKVDPPDGLNDEMQIQVIARDNEGREAVSIFKFTVGVGKDKAKVSSRSSLSEQIFLAAKRSTPWLDRLHSQTGRADVDKPHVARPHAAAHQAQVRG